MESTESTNKLVVLNSQPESLKVEAIGTTTPNVSLEVPDGGVKAWLTVFGGWMVLFCTFGSSNSFGVFQDLYTLSGTSSASNISWIGSLQLFFMFSMGLPAGKLFDEGYFHETQITASIFYVFCILMLSLADPTKYYQLILSQGVGMGIGQGMLLVPALSIQAHYWKKRRAMAMGIVLTGSSAGGIVYPIMLNQLLNNARVGFAWTVRASAFLTLGLLATACCIMSTRLPSAKHRPSGPKPNIKSILTDVPYMVAVAGVFLVFWGIFFPYFYLQLYVNVKGLSSNLAFYTIAILNAASFPGRVLPNLLADSWGHFNLIVPVSGICGGLVFAMFHLESAGPVVVFSVLYGFFSGAFISLLPPTIAVLAKDINEIGVRMGLGYFLTSWALLTGTPIVGALLGSDNDWTKPILFSGILMIAGTAFILLSRQLLVQGQRSQRI